jgi:hypothetical protein
MLLVAVVVALEEKVTGDGVGEEEALDTDPLW